MGNIYVNQQKKKKEDWNVLKIVRITSDLCNCPTYRAPYSLHWMRPTNEKSAQLFQITEVKFKMQPESLLPIRGI